ncbi:alpha-(1-_6)-mannopyranosyltransferase A [Corynebacterium freneyi]|uniref:alpha-(1->6)-mannopyranosyltransferase A n=1 Tax=Corynebacterium freneyi TaxID=134034 RepID=UPI00254D07BC|nr:alpha-(1->6)-mannopyranosyltransferase A [Corynebacterium freneyi]MDK8768392.1 alpha-(1->6)-mannopyranosyltransferase A [Corynebacterium freneyi]
MTADAAITSTPSPGTAPAVGKPEAAPAARDRWWTDSAKLGFVGALFVALGSYGAGATRYRGGIVDALGLGWITYGHGFALFEIFIWVGIVGILAAWLLAGRRLIFGRPAPAVDRLRTLNRSLLWWLIPLSVSAPVFSRDIYSYLMQGAMMRDGFDPYSEGAAVNPGPMLLEVSADWRNTTTPYGPLHLGINEVITRIVGDNITVGIVLFRILCVLGFLAIVWSVPRIAVKLGGDPALAQWLGVLNPLVLLHLVAGLHNESIMVGLVSLALAAGLMMPRLRGAVVAALLIGVAVSLKATAVIALPFLVWIAVTRGGELADWSAVFRRVPALLGYGIGMSALMVGALTAVTWLTGSTWGWLTEISGNTKVINPLAAPSAVAGAIAAVMAWIDDTVVFNSIVAVTRRVSSVIMVVGLVACWFVFRQNPRRNVAGMVAAYGVAVVFNAVALPWYYASLLTPIGTFRPPRWLVQGTVVATLILCLSFSGGGNNRFYDVPWMIVITVAAWFALRWLVNGDVRRAVRWRGSLDDDPPR